MKWYHSPNSAWYYWKWIPRWWHTPWSPIKLFVIGWQTWIDVRKSHE